MLTDRYDNTLTTASQKARDGYVEAVDLMLAGQAGTVEGFDAVTMEDPGFALGWVGLARAHHYLGNAPGFTAAMARARALTKGLTTREAGHVAAFDLLMSGKTQQAYAAIREHVDAYPRDALVAQTCSSVFGLIGFSGQPGREAEMLAFTAGLLPHYGDDWWAQSQYAFALCETGNLAKADALIDYAMMLNPRNAHGAHVRSHVSYEIGETDVGRRYLADWLEDYDPGGLMYTHLHWHEALWALEQGDTDAMWKLVDASVAPESGSASPAINIMCDTVAILHRATLAGLSVPAARWESVSEYAQRAFPTTGNAFIDVHAALAHAMAGREEALTAIIDNPSGPAADLVPDLAQGF